MCQTFQESPEPLSNKLPPSSRPRKKTSIHQTLMNKLSAANEMAHAVAILDYQLQWVDKGVEVSDSTNFSSVTCCQMYLHPKVLEMSCKQHEPEETRRRL